MNHRERHRGQQPEDTTLFDEAQVIKMKQALVDFCWLLTHGYAAPSSLKLVGDRYQLTDRQRLLLMRSASTDDQRQERIRKQQSAAMVAGCDLFIDGFNILITIESALSQGYLFIGQDGCYRDLSSVHGTYKRVQETQLAINLVGRTLYELQIRQAVWLLDRPVSNSGLLRKILTESAKEFDWDWQIELCDSPDAELKKVHGPVATTDSVILDTANAWFHLNKQVIDTHISDANLIDLRDIAS